MAWATRSKTFRVFTWWGVLILSVAISLLVGLFIALFWPSVFTGTSSFFVSDPAALLGTMIQQSAAQTGLPEAGSLKPTPERLSAILSSRLIRSKLVQKHKLDQRLGMTSVEAEEALARMTKINQIGTEGFSIAVTCKGYTPLRVAISHTLRREEARQLCAALANDFLSELQNYVTTTSVSEARKKRQFIEQAQQQVQHELAQAQTGISRLQLSNELVEPADKSALVNDRIKSLYQASADASAQTDQTASSLRKAQGQLGHVDSMRIASIVEMRNPIISQLEQKLADLRVELATQEAQGKTRQNRDVVQILSAITSTENQLVQIKQDVHKEVARSSNPTFEKLSGQVVDLQVNLAGARARASRTKQLLRQARADLAELPPVVREYAALKQDQDVQFAALAALKQSLAVARVQEQQSKRAGEFLVLDEAVAPADLFKPPVWLGMALAFGVMLCIMGLISLNRMIFGV